METAIGKTRSGLVVKIPHNKLSQLDVIQTFSLLSDSDFVDTYAMCQALYVHVSSRKITEPYAENLHIYIEAMHEMFLLSTKDENLTLSVFDFLAAGRELLNAEFREGK